MFGVPQDIDFSFLHGLTLDDVQRWDHGFMLKLASERQIHVEGGNRIEGLAPNGSPATLDDLVGQSIVSVSPQSRTELRIVFTPHITLTLFDDSPEFECIGIYPECIII